MRISKIIFIIIFIVITVSLWPGEEILDPLPRRVEAVLAATSPTDIYDYCKIMASREFAGRHTGHEGYTAAAQWAAGKFRQWGLSPMSEEAGYLQAYPSPYTVVDKAEMTLYLPPAGEAAGTAKTTNGKKGEEIKLELEQDFLPLLYSDSGDKRAGLVFAGWGIHAPAVGYDDYAGLDVKGKFVLCFRGTPDPADERLTAYDYHHIRMQAAYEKGALGIFYIYPEPVANPNGVWLKGFTPAILSCGTADKLLKEKGFTAETLKQKLEKEKKPFSFVLGAEAGYRVESRHFPGGIGYNVVAMVEGFDPNLKKECLVMGGHYDHCGLHVGLLFRGANDNASGCAAIMEIAHMFASSDIRLARTVIFVLFGGEEMGLTGSNYFAAHLPAGIEKVATMFNFDMVGEGDGTVCVISKDRPQLKEALDNAAKRVQTLKTTAFISGVGPRSSDYAPFYLQGAGCIAFFSNGPHLHYHKTGDTIYRINPDIMADVARLAFLTSYFLELR